MAWDQTYEQAMQAGREYGIPEEDLGKMWVEYYELGQAVREGKLSDAVATQAFGAFCEKLARERYGQ